MVATKAKTKPANKAANHNMVDINIKLLPHPTKLEAFNTVINQVSPPPTKQLPSQPPLITVTQALLTSPEESLTEAHKLWSEDPIMSSHPQSLKLVATHQSYTAVPTHHVPISAQPQLQPPLVWPNHLELLAQFPQPD